MKNYLVHGYGGYKQSFFIEIVVKNDPNIREGHCKKQNKSTDVTLTCTSKARLVVSTQKASQQ